MKNKRKSRNDKKEGKLRLIDEGTDEDMAEATIFTVKAAQRKGKKIEERNKIIKKVHVVFIYNLLNHHCFVTIVAHT